MLQGLGLARGDGRYARLELKGESLRKLRTAKNARLDEAIAN
jgi:hypothetical protein